ncbi:Ubiquinone/menaquinone biosynthesis C-methylase UbiE [Chitinophaga sp. CF118]|uniref:class I SAM-dependent methyltransferase n=1 Tax=Chitinophaga sp. CF118 TaxID=1884367 RepID=UPI0008EF2B33|nr:class I SAM-dependent methyltransferase [Chitinophaga sp. CF118]SFD80328.1 Ubiquinone/menaquinone biosynthesis C-methylase UbiE [Chitinophaga sp. CF118]
MEKFECLYLNKDCRGGLIFSAPIHYLVNQIDEVDGTTVLDAGCGNGEMSIFFALKGASIIGIDINGDRLSEAQNNSHRYQVGNNCTFINTTTENMSMITNECIDNVFSMSTIQYMQRDKVIREYLRVLTKDGSLILIENLPFNPFINIYRLFRKITANTERKKSYIKSIKGYLTFTEIENLKDHFETINHKEFHLFGVLAILLFNNKIRFYKLLEKPLAIVDRFLLYVFPPLKKLCWITAIVCSKKK